jgi:signal transduction histidine kinase/tetratricopeptide (TPR) repeat protein
VRKSIKYHIHNMKSIPALILFLLITNCLFGQKGINSLLSDLDQAKGDSQKIAVYKKIIIHYSVSHPDSENWYAEQGIQYSIKHKYGIGEAMIQGQMAMLDENQGRLNKGKERTELALKIYRKQNYLQGVAEMTHNLGAIEADNGNFDIAIKYFINALKIYDSTTDNHGLMLTYMNIGNLYVDHMDTANAWKYLRKAVEVSEKTPLSDATIFLYNIIGVMYAERGDEDTALKIFLNNLELSDKREFINSHVECLLYIGEFYSEKGDNERSIGYLKKGLALANEYNIPEMEANLILEIAKIEEKTDPKQAMNYLNQAKELCERIHNKTFEVSVYQEIASLCKKEGDYKGALEATEQKQKFKDSIFSINKTKEIANIADAYEFEKSNNRVAQLEIISEKNANERNVIVIIAVIVIVILGVLSFFYRKIMILNRQLVKSKQELKELNDMKGKLFSVVGHDLRGPIASIPVVLDIYDDAGTSAEEKKFILDNLREHAKVSVETLDKLLYWGQSVVKGNKIHQVSFHPKNYIKEAIEFKRIAAAEKNIEVTDTTLEDTCVYADETHFDFIIRNLLANAIKYTNNNGRIGISADRDAKPGFIVFAVKDNGIGMAKDVLARLFNPVNSMAGTANEKGNGIGLMLCKEFANQNGGDIWVESEPGRGSIFYVSIWKAA